MSSSAVPPSSTGDEKKWYKKLPKVVNFDSLQAGDILIQKLYGKKTCVDTAIRGGQSIRCVSKYAAHGSVLSRHVLIVYEGGEGGQCIHASSPNGVDSVDLPRLLEGDDYLIYRSSSPDDAAFAAKAAKALNSGHCLKYSKSHCVGTVSPGQEFGKDAKARAKALYQLMNREEGPFDTDVKIALPKAEITAVTCSEFVTYCFQCRQDPDRADPYIKLDAKHTSPRHLEHFLVTNPDKFVLQGHMSIKTKKAVEGSLPKTGEGHFVSESRSQKKAKSQKKKTSGADVESVIPEDEKEEIEPSSAMKKKKIKGTKKKSRKVEEVID